MTDKEFLSWIYARLVKVHGEEPLMDYMHKLSAIISATPADRVTANCSSPALTIGQSKVRTVEQIENTLKRVEYNPIQTENISYLRGWEHALRWVLGQNMGVPAHEW